MRRFSDPRTTEGTERIKATLANAGLSQNDNALYQAIFLLIDKVVELSKKVDALEEKLGQGNAQNP